MYEFLLVRVLLILWGNTGNTVLKGALVQGE